MISNKEFKDRIYKLVGDKYCINSEYKGRHKKVSIKHNTCGYCWEVEAGAFLGNKNKKGSRCPNCYGNITKTTLDFSEEVFEKGNHKYLLRSEYINAHTKVEIEHTICGNTYSVVPMSFTKGTRCPYCSNKKINNEEVSRRLYRITKGDFLLESNYTGVFDYLYVRHSKCGTLCKTTLAKLDAGVYPSCIKCNPSSKGESLIEKVLSDMSLEFDQQKRFNDESIKNLSYDFLIKDMNILIEYQGLQHYKPVQFFGGSSAYIKQVYRDNLKRNFAKNNNYTLIEIPYTVNSYEQIYKIIYNKVCKAEAPVPKIRSMI